MCADIEQEGDVCIGFLNEEDAASECEDECPDSVTDADDMALPSMVGEELASTKLICGTVPHFTNFAVLLKGGVNGASKTCDSEDGLWIFGSYEVDLVVVMGMIGFTLIVVLLLGLFARKIPLLRAITEQSMASQDSLRKLRKERQQMAMLSAESVDPQ